ncbi:MAG: hypothetical protein U1E42_08265 [Rhodospirillales bacterium]
MSITAIAPRRSAAVAESDDAPLSGFRLTRPPLRAANASGRLTPISGHGNLLPLGYGFEAGPAMTAREGNLPADADALPMDGTWRWLGLLSCWLSSALVASVFILALN